MMSEGTLASGSEAVWGQWLTRGAAAVLLLAGAYLVFQDLWRIGGLVVVGVAMVTLIAGEVLAARRAAAKRWVVDTGDGFRWTGGPVEIVVADGQVTAVQLAYRHKYAAGLHQQTTRDFQVWVEGRPAPLRMTTRIATGATDPLVAMIQRICDDLKERVAADLAGGQPLSGDDWTLRPSELVFRQGRTFRAMPLLQIEKVGLFDDKLCVWCLGEDEPAARIAPSSRNAAVLASLLSDWIAHRQEKALSQTAAKDATAPPTVADGSGLGRVLFERRKRKMAVYLSLAALLAFWIGLALILGGENPIVGGVLVAASVASAYVAWGWFRFVFRCHERGLYRKWGRRELRIPYTEITRFTYSATRHFHNGVYTGTRFLMKCASPRGSVAYSALINAPDQELDHLRDHIAKVISDRMLRQLKEGGPVPWTADMTFLPEGLQFRRAASLGRRKPAEVLPYHQIRTLDLQAGFFYLWNQTERPPVISKPVSTPNFFPGFYTILSLHQRPAAG